MDKQTDTQSPLKTVPTSACAITYCLQVFVNLDKISVQLALLGLRACKMIIVSIRLWLMLADSLPLYLK